MNQLLLLLYFVFLYHVAPEVLDREQTVLVDHVALGIAFLWERDRAWVYVCVPVAKGSDREHVGVPVNENIALFKHGRSCGIVVMSVSDEKASSALIHKHVVGKNRELKHHLVNLCVAVSAHAGKLALDLV